MEGGSYSTVTLQIQGASIECNRKDLAEHSDYFKAMFEGNFVESCKRVIPLNGIELEAMNIILKLLWDHEYVIAEASILSVLQAACMLQFLQVKEICIERIDTILSINNCLKIWLYTEELDLKVIYLKAKLIALLEFMFVKDTGCFLELSLEEVINYLGNINLCCSTEFTVFESINTWFHNSEEKNMDDLLKLLHCVDFTKIRVGEIYEMIASSSIAAYDTLSEALKCIIAIKNGTEYFNFKEQCIQYANSLLASKNRNSSGFPCILSDNYSEQGKVPPDSTVLYYDKFKRKRKYNVLEDSSLNTDFSVIYVDTKGLILKKLINVKSQRCANLDGFKLIGYKQFIFLYGGEYLLGKGDWNCQFHTYDLIKENWTQKRLLPFPRRHFETCVCEKYLFIVGGTGPFRVIQENIFWYNVEQEEWSREHKLPCSGRQIKCCPFDKQLFILNINNKCGYTFNPENEEWTKLKICDTNNILPCYSKKLCLFSYRTSIYIKENKLFELKVQGNRLTIVNQIVLSGVINKSAIYHVESVLCNNVLYSLSKQWNEDNNGQTIALESFNVDTHEVLETYRGNEEVLEVDNEIFKFKSSLIIFNVFHQNLVGGNDLINTC